MKSLNEIWADEMNGTAESGTYFKALKDKTGLQDKKDFVTGYRAVKSGRITTEWTDRRIDKHFPGVNKEAFFNGMLDALEGDSFRYNKIKDDVC